MLRARHGEFSSPCVIALAKINQLLRISCRYAIFFLVAIHEGVSPEINSGVYTAHLTANLLRRFNGSPLATLKIDRVTLVSIWIMIGLIFAEVG